MKRFGLALIIVMLVGFGCSQDKAPVPKVPSLAAQLPATTDGFIRFSSFQSVYQGLAVNVETALGQPIENLEEITKTLQLNPFDLEALTGIGVDTTKPVLLAFSDIVIDDTQEKPHFNLLLAVPVTDGKKALQYLEDTLRVHHPQIDLQKTGEITKMTSPKGKAPIFWALKNDVLWFAGNPQTSALGFLESVLDGKTKLSENQRFKELSQKIDLTGDLSFYANIGDFIQRNFKNLEALYKESALTTTNKGKPVPDMSAGLRYIADYEGAGLNIKLNSPHLRFDSAVLIKDQSPMFNVVKDVKIQRDTLLGQKVDPVLMLAMAFNIGEYINMLTEMFGDQGKETMTAGMQQIEQQTGINPQTEIIDNLGGNINLGIFDGASITMTNINAILTLSIKDQAKALTTLDKVVGKLPENKRRFVKKDEIEGIPTYQVNLGAAQLYLGIAPTQLVITAGKPMFEKAQQAELDDGFTTRLEDPALAGSMKAANSMIYLDFQEVSHVANTLGAFAQKNPKARDGFDKATQLMQELDYLALSSQMEGRTMFGNFTLQTKFEQPFAVRLAQIIEGWKIAPAAAQ